MALVVTSLAKPTAWILPRSTSRLPASPPTLTSPSRPLRPVTTGSMSPGVAACPLSGMLTGSTTTSPNRRPPEASSAILLTPCSFLTSLLACGPSAWPMPTSPPAPRAPETGRPRRPRTRSTPSIPAPLVAPLPAWTLAPRSSCTPRPPSATATAGPRPAPLARTLTLIGTCPTGAPSAATSIRARAPAPSTRQPWFPAPTWRPA
mmetsp:Transcript_120637/g.292803  ORF Transcript_120637/g.292803 Transcript_120637/m.292803 type:complete len:205 (-) Transcript_120637:555-1169(-)